MTFTTSARAIVAAVSLVFSAAAFGADKQPSDKKPRRLESVTWNSVDHKLTWTISSGEKSSGQYKATSSESYEIQMDQAIMSFKGENRRFSDEEAASVHALMDLIAKYAVESTVWWDNGQGIKLDKNGKPEPVQQQPHPQQKPKAPPKDVTIAQVLLP